MTVQTVPMFPCPVCGGQLPEVPRVHARLRERERTRLQAVARTRQTDAVHHAVTDWEQTQAASAIGHFLRHGRPGPSRFQPPAGVLAGVVYEDGSVRPGTRLVDGYVVRAAA